MKPSDKKHDEQSEAPSAQRPTGKDTVEFETAQASGADSAAELKAKDDQILRLQAEMENVRARTSREISDVRKYSALPVVTDLLPVIDNIDRAIEAAEKTGEAENLLAGFRLVKQQLHTLLSREECVPIPAEGEVFDPNFHQAILQQPSDSVPAGNVILVAQQGYKLHDRVVRPAQVIVSSGKG